MIQLGGKDFVDWLKPECYNHLEAGGWSAENKSHPRITRLGISEFKTLVWISDDIGW